MATSKSDTMPYLSENYAQAPMEFKASTGATQVRSFKRYTHSVEFIVYLAPLRPSKSV